MPCPLHTPLMGSTSSLHLMIQRFGSGKLGVGRPLKGHSHTMCSIAYSLDGQHIVS